VPAGFALWASASLSFIPLVWSLAKLRPLSQTLRAILWGLGIALLPMSALGAFLHTTTHHRPLGMVTYAFIGSALAVAIVFACVRALHSAKAFGSGAKSVERIVGSLATLAALGSLAVLVGNTRGTAQGTIMDLGWGAFLTLATLRLDDTLRRNRDAVRGLKRTPLFVPLLGWGLLLGVGVVGAMNTEPAIEALDRAPILGGPVLVLLR
jgi:hypothetical protein